jgi:signal transduction histidine kinase
VLEHIGLVASLEGYCSDVEKEHGLKVSFHAQHLGDVPPDRALCLYRATQEALANAVKHAEAGSIRVRLVREGSNAVLTVADDGRGFDLAVARRRAGLGLISLEERARLVGGQLTITTGSGRGTEVRIVVPLPEERDGASDGPAG